MFYAAGQDVGYVRYFGMGILTTSDTENAINIR